MFRGEKLPGVANPRLRSIAPFVCDFDVVEHVLNVPLWIAWVLPMPDFDSPHGEDAPLWSRYLVDAPDVLVQLVTLAAWERCRLHVLLPEDIPSRSPPKVARCFAIWSAQEPGNDQGTWYFETDAGDFFNPVTTLNVGQAKKTTLRWKDFESDFLLR